MLDRLNRYGLPIKYGIIGFVGGIIGVFLFGVIGQSLGGASYISIPIAAGIGGVIGGWIRRKRGRHD